MSPDFLVATFVVLIASSYSFSNAHNSPKIASKSTSCVSSIFAMEYLKLSILGTLRSEDKGLPSFAGCF
uniref:Putative secreted protein n=1 Tax=Panstrongylus lignarius TaxID=156445 RepID=A0A224Y1E0_9HEMI